MTKLLIYGTLYNLLAIVLSRIKLQQAGQSLYDTCLDCLLGVSEFF